MATSKIKARPSYLGQSTEFPFIGYARDNNFVIFLVPLSETMPNGNYNVTIDGGFIENVGSIVKANYSVRGKYRSAIFLQTSSLTASQNKVFMGTFTLTIS